jgi:hypothetical protein
MTIPKTLGPLRYAAVAATLAMGVPAAANDATGAQVREALDSPAQVHPRLFMRPGDPERLRARIADDATARLMAARVIARADRGLGAETPERTMRGRRLLHVSRDVMQRLVSLSMAWHLTGEARYVDRAAADLRAIAAFDDWNPSHFLDTAEMTFGAAVAYDWLHEPLDEATLETTRRAIYEKGLKPGLASDDFWWIRASSNWNQVCHGGLVAGALALREHRPDAARRIIERAVRHVPNAMDSYSPNGAYPEGPGYWAYGTSYNVLLLAMFDSALGTTFGLEEARGFDRTGAFPALITGPSGQTFNYADGGSGRSFQPAVYWLSRRFSKPGWAAIEDRFLDPETAPGEHPPESRLMPFALLWRRDPGDAAPELPRHWTSGGPVPISLHRESWDRPNAVFVGFKAGSPSGPHGHMDAGSFVLDADGVRWAHDLGSESYHRIESRGMSLWRSNQDADRWTVFRQNNFSHNTLVIDGKLQRAAADAPMARFSADPDFPHSVADLSPVYGGQADIVHRGVALLPGGSVLIRDHFTGLRPEAEVRWGMVTRASARKTGGSTLELHQDGEALELSVHGDPDVSWQWLDTSEPRNEWDSPNPGTAMAAFTATASPDGTLDLTVILRPATRETPEITARHLAAPLEWSAPEK